MIVVVKEVIEAVAVMVVVVMVVVTTVVAVMVVATDHQCKCTTQPVRSAEKIAKFLLDPAILNRFFVIIASRAKIVIQMVADQVKAEILTDVMVVVVVVEEEVIATTKCMMQFVVIAAEIAKYRSNLPVINRFIAINVLEGIRI